MSTIFAGNTTTTSLVQTGDISGNLVLSSVGNIVLTPGTGYGVVWANNAAFSSGGGGGLTMGTVQTANLTAVSSTIYPINTTNGNITATLPATPTAGTQIQFVDYAGTFSSNNFTINRNGSNIAGVASSVTVTSSGASVGLLYIDSTKGWVPYTGFPTSPVGTYQIDYIVVAGGGGGSGGTYHGGGGGAGGYITNASVVVAPGTSYSITVGAGGAGGSGSSIGGNGANSTFNSQTAIGGGTGGNYSSTTSGAPGGSGGGGAGATPQSTVAPGGAGTAGQGYAGGNGSGNAANAYGAGGGGGATGLGQNGTSSYGGNGGPGVTWNGTTYCGGGGGSTYNGSGTYPAGSGGTGGGGAGGTGTGATSGTANTGGGGGGGERNGTATGGNGGAGVVVIRYLGSSQRATGGVVTITGGYVYDTFNSSSTYIA